MTQATVKDLIDYLEQFDHDVIVVPDASSAKDYIRFVSIETFFDEFIECDDDGNAVK